MPLLASPLIRRQYRDDTGKLFTHAEQPSKRWEPMVRVPDITLPALGLLEQWENRWYDCTARRYASGFPIDNAPYVILGITHTSQAAHHDWRDFQRIKNDVVSTEWEGVELYPSESRLVDPSNRFYLWVVPPGILRWGLPNNRRKVLRSDSKEAHAPQRPFAEEA